MKATRKTRGELLDEAIRLRRTVRFTYNGEPRLVEPQTHGFNAKGEPFLRGYQKSGSSTGRQVTGLKLFEVGKMKGLRTTKEIFAGARPEHQPDDSAMKTVVTTLPKSEHGSLWIGTSGFQYPEWRGKFYPEDLPPAKMLSFYGTQFATTEINYTFRHMPSAATLKKWADLTPENFRFSLKAPQRITHFGRLRGQENTTAHFLEMARQLGQKLGAILFQLPPQFHKDLSTLRVFLQQLPTDVRAAFEFRHASWFCDEVYDALQNRGAALCLAESETLATPREVTAGFGYFRLRRTDYTASVLRNWSRFIRAQKERWKDVFVYFKHEDRAVGPAFAAQMLRLLKAYATKGRPA